VSSVAALGHVGISVADMDTMTRFYTEVLGLTVTDGGGPGARIVFLSADPAREQHEFVLSANPELHANAQQISFTVASLDDLRELYHAIKARPDCSDMRVTNHGIAIGCYFLDPEKNRIEVYWSTGMDYVQPAVGPIDLDQSNAAILAALGSMPPRPSVTPHLYGEDQGKRLPAAAGG